MVLFFVGTLVVSLVGLASLIYIKHFELSTGRIILGSVRPQIGEFFHTILFLVERVAPELARIYGHSAWRALLSLMHRSAAWLTIHAERLLESTLQTLRHTTNTGRLPTRSGEASAFLREVAEHKKKLVQAQLQKE